MTNKEIEVLVKIPPVAEWPDYAHTYVATFMHEGEAMTPKVIITRAEAERMEKDQFPLYPELSEEGEK